MVKAYFQEYLEWIIIDLDVFLYQVVQFWVDLKELVVVRTSDLGAGAVVRCYYCGRSFALVKHADFAEVHSWLQHPDHLLLLSVAELISDEDVTLSLRDEVDVVVAGNKFFVLMTDEKLWSVQHRIHSFYYVVCNL